MSKKKISPEAQAIISASDAGYHATTVARAEQFLGSHPDSQRAWLDLGLSLGQLARYVEAEQAFLKVIELSGDDPAAAMYGEIGNLYRAKGDFDSAISWYQKQIDADSMDSMGYLLLGNIHMRRGNFTASEAAFHSALACQQVYLDEVHFALGLVNRCMGRLSESKSHFEKAVEFDRNFVEAQIALKDVKSALSES